MKNETSVFKSLSGIDISTMVKKKGNFWYMPWSNAVREVTKNFPDFNWEFTSYDGLPFLKTELGYFVECSVTINGLTKKQLMPVLDFKNQTNMAPKASDINKTQMRALAKAIALHGLGLDLWAGEDLVEDFVNSINESVITNDQAGELISLAEGKGRSEQDICNWATTQFKRKVGSVSELTESEYKTAFNMVANA